MSATLVRGSSSPFQTKVSKDRKDRETDVVTVEGRYEDLKLADPGDWVKDGMTLESSHVESTDDGMGRLTIRCIGYDDGILASAIRTTFRVGMEVVQYDLEDHPYLADDRDIILMWLATDESKRVDNGTYKYADKNGDLQTIDGGKAEDFCNAYMAGIKTFNRYYPVIDKISTWKNPPGLNRNGRSFTGGSPTFSQGIGTYDAPPITLNGYAQNCFFKSKDEWQENADKTWTRTEQWTYTPEPSTGDHAWIYNEL